MGVFYFVFLVLFGLFVLGLVGVVGLGVELFVVFRVLCIVVVM